MFPILASWHPFLEPIPIWGNAVWPWLLLPLAAAVSIVYKAVKCRSMRQVPREAAGITLWIVLGMVAAAVVLALIVEAVQWRPS